MQQHQAFRQVLMAIILTAATYLRFRLGATFDGRSYVDVVAAADVRSKTKRRFSMVKYIAFVDRMYQDYPVETCKEVSVGTELPSL